MPGDNCSVKGCGSNRRTKGIGIFQILAENVNKEWRKMFLGEILKFREVDANFKRQINENNVFVCEKHFHKNEIEICEYPFLNAMRV